MLKKVIHLVIPMLILAFSGCGDAHYAPMDYKIFKGTPAWELATAVKNNDREKIRKIIDRGDIDINYQENEYGFTVLMCALCNSDSFFHKTELETIRTLLELGADPNLYSGKRQTGENAVLVACDCNYADGLRLLLEYGGDPNSRYIRIGRWRNDDTALMTAISALSDNPDLRLRCVKLLLDAGADINAVNKSDKRGALSQCLMWGRYDIMLYLLQRGIDYNRLIWIYRPGSSNKSNFVGILEALREKVLDLDSVEYQYKLKIIEFLKAKGLDYYSTPIPDRIVSEVKKLYPERWEEYLEVY